MLMPTEIFPESNSKIFIGFSRFIFLLWTVSVTLEQVVIETVRLIANRCLVEIQGLSLSSQSGKVGYHSVSKQYL